MTEEPVQLEVFGDESTASNDRYAIYSMVGIKINAIPNAAKEIANLKAHFQLPNDERIHCRVIFSRHQREKTAWGKLSDSQIIDFMKCFIECMKPLGLLWSYGYVDMRDILNLPHPKKISGKFSSEIGREFSFAFGAKQAQQFAYSAAEMPYIQEFGNNVRFWCDQDSTKIEWFGRRKQPHNINRGVGMKAAIDLPSKAHKSMLEIADFFAYTASRHLCAEQKFGQNIFRKTHEIFNPRFSKLNIDPSLFGGDENTIDWLKKSQPFSE